MALTGARLPTLCAVFFALLVCAIVIRLPTSPVRSGVGPIIFPSTPKHGAEARKWGSLESAARTAKAKKNWAGAEADYQVEARMRYCPFREEVWVELGLMRDYQGKKDEAFLAYRKGFGIGSHHGPAVGGRSPELAEAAARCGLKCEDRGLHADACECYYTARRLESITGRAPAMTLDPSTTSPSAARRLLGIVLHDAESQDRYGRGPI